MSLKETAIYIGDKIFDIMMKMIIQDVPNLSHFNEQFNIIDRISLHNYYFCVGFGKLGGIKIVPFIPRFAISYCCIESLHFVLFIGTL